MTGLSLLSGVCIVPALKADSAGLWAALELGLSYLHESVHSSPDELLQPTNGLYILIVAVARASPCPS